MSTKPVVVTLSALDTGVSALQQTIGDIEARLTALESELQPMLGSWSGDARDEYLAQKLIWDRAAADLVSVLADLTKSVSASHYGYTDLHRLLTEAWQ